MMSDFFKKLTDEEELTQNITSMIDVIFILLIFFMVSTQFKKNSLPLNLPEAEKSIQEAKDETHTLSVTKDEIEYDGNKLSMEDLDKILSEEHDRKADLSLSLECDKSVEFERVVQILTKIQNAGIDKIGIIHETLD